MRAVSLYGTSFSDVYQSCVAGVNDPSRVALLMAALPVLQVEVGNYEFLARGENLYLIPGVKTKLSDIVRGGLTRKDLKDLYEVNMVGKSMVARDHYDRILLSPKFKKCPYCSLGQATTLDHYLPKSRFPQFSVSVSNLVPSCKDCQGKKGRGYALKKVSQTLHPYFDNPVYFSESWVKARLLHYPVLSVEFYVDPPPSWSAEMCERVEAHFIAHDLDKRYSVEAASEVSSVNQSVADLRASGDFPEIRRMLLRQAKGHGENCVNSWQSALYSTLANDVWYCTTPVL